VSVPKVLVLANEDHELRIAHVLAGEGVDVSIFGSAKSGRYPSVEAPTGFDVVIGYTEAVLAVAEATGAAAVTAADVDTSPVPTVAGASLLGVGLAVAARLEASGSDVSRVAIAYPGGPTVGGVTMNFPAPIGRVQGTLLNESDLDVLSAATPAPWAAIVVEADTGDQAVIDEHRFLTAICLAAGVALIPPAGIVKVWDGPDAYLSKAETMGLVGAQKK